MKITGKEAEKLDNLGFGLMENGHITLNEYEKRYCQEKEYIKSKDKFTGSEKVYTVFKELRKHGIISRFSEDTELIRVYQKGYRPGEERTKYIMKVVEKEFPDKKEIENLISLSKKMRKELIIAIVEKNITYIKITQTSLF